MFKAKNAITLQKHNFLQSLWADFPFKHNMYDWLIDLDILKEPVGF